jgi:hypothetical protein
LHKGPVGTPTIYRAAGEHMKLKELMDQIKDKRAEASVDPSECDPRVRAGAEGLVRAAKEVVVRLEREYQEEVIKSAVIIAVSGKGSEKFARTSKDAFHTLSVDYQGITNRLVDSIRKRGGQEEYNNQEHWMLMAELNQIKLEYGIVQIPAPTINHYTDNVFYQPLRKAIDNLFRKNYDSSLYSAITRREIGKMALAAEFDGKLLPVVVYNYTGEVDNLMLPQPTEVLEVNEDEVSDSLVKKVLLNVKNKLKKNSNEQNSELTDNPNKG